MDVMVNRKIIFKSLDTWKVFWHTIKNKTSKENIYVRIRQPKQSAKPEALGLPGWLRFVD
jgi:hypothetical protein